MIKSLARADLVRYFHNTLKVYRPSGEPFGPFEDIFYIDYCRRPTNIIMLSQIDFSKKYSSSAKVTMKELNAGTRRIAKDFEGNAVLCVVKYGKDEHEAIVTPLNLDEITDGIFPVD